MPNTPAPLTLTPEQRAKYERTMHRLFEQYQQNAWAQTMNQRLWARLVRPTPDEVATPTDPQTATEAALSPPGESLTYAALQRTYEQCMTGRSPQYHRIAFHGQEYEITPDQVNQIRYAGSPDAVEAGTPVVAVPGDMLNENGEEIREDIHYVFNGHPIQWRNMTASITVDKPKNWEDQKTVEMWLNERPANTRRAYQYEIHRFMQFVGAHSHERKLDSVCVEDIQTFVGTLGRLKASSKARAIGAMKSFYAYCLKIGHLKYDPWSTIKMPKVNDDLAQRILSHEEVTLVIRNIQRPKVRAMVALMYMAGLRIQEVITLTWNNVISRNLDEGQITVIGKGDKSRTIMLSPAAWQILQCTPRHCSTLVFVTSRGREFQQSEIWRAVRTSAQDAGITKPLSPHWFRHAHASHALENGADINLVRETLGHESLNTTSRYTHARPDRSSSQFVTLEDF